MTITLNQILELGAEIRPEQKTMYGEVYLLKNNGFNFFFRVKNNQITSSWKNKQLTDSEIKYGQNNGLDF